MLSTAQSSTALNSSHGDLPRAEYRWKRWTLLKIEKKTFSNAGMLAGDLV